MTPLPSTEGMPCRPPPQVRCACRDMDTASSRGWRRVGRLVPRVGPSAGRNWQLLLTRTFPGLASGPSGSLKTAAPFGWQPCGGCGSPWDDPWPLRGLGRGAKGGDGWGGGRVVRGETQRLEATLLRPLGPNMVSSPQARQLVPGPQLSRS